MGAFELLDNDIADYGSFAVVPWTVNHDGGLASDRIPELLLFALKVADILPINEPIENKLLHITISMIQKVSYCKHNSTLGGRRQDCKDGKLQRVCAAASERRSL